VPENSPLKAGSTQRQEGRQFFGWLNTAGLWARGMLSDEYGVKATRYSLGHRGK